MNKAVLISIRPEWIHKIFNCEKTIEIRKTSPKLETPFKCYIYCTKSVGSYIADGTKWGESPVVLVVDLVGAFEEESAKGLLGARNGKVIGEFICDEIKTYLPDDFVGAQDLNGTIREKPIDGEYGYWIPDQEQTCLTYCEILKYGDGKTLYGWHISNLKNYDEPKELGDFKRYNRTEENSPCAHAKWLYEPFDTCRECNLKRPPQSWCYVEDNTP